MEIADIDESGTINKTEFAAFIKKLDKAMDDDKVNGIFESTADGSEELSVELFGKATFEALKDMEITKEEAADEEE
jgi:Ca2+-binding EF-hand superfamily protein